MNKSFLSVSPSEGNGNAQVVINVKENMSLDERSESLNIRTANRVEKQVRITQDPGMPLIRRGCGTKKGEESSRYLLMRRAKISW